MIYLNPCPKCKSDNLYIRREHTSGFMQVYCLDCNFALDLDARFPCETETIKEEWNRKASNPDIVRNATVQLKRCPCCGAKARLEQYSLDIESESDPDSFDIVCPECGLNINDSSRENVIYKWNRRMLA